MSTNTLVVAFLIASTGAVRAAEWTSPAEVQHEFRRAVAYRARLAGEFLVVEATHEPGWHTCAMDNKRRAEEKLAGKQSLGIDTPTGITVTQGLEVVGPWHQSTPKDFSKPELHWFTWGFEGQALFVAKVRRTGAGPARVAIGGQACTDTICKRVEVELSLPLSGAKVSGGGNVDWKALVQVR